MPSSTNQPLLNSPNKPKLTLKILYFSLAISTILISCIYLAQHLIKPSQIDLCNRALNPKECQAFVSEVVTNEAIVTLTPKDGTFVLQRMLMNHVRVMNAAISETKKLKSKINDQTEQGSLTDCVELTEVSVDLVLDSIKALANPIGKSHADVQAWLSGVLTNHATCFDGLPSNAKKSVGKTVEQLISRARATLAITTSIFDQTNTKTLMEYSINSLRGNLPTWITAADRKLMEINSSSGVKGDVVVSKDGSGNYTTVVAAVAAAPNKSKKRFVIYVKKGIYKENVEVGKSKKNVMIIGDGMDLTIITGDLNVVDGSTTFNSATLAAVGEGFMLQDITIRNTAGPEKHQAVALRVGADQSIINRCRIDAYQDTLYTHSLRQFYRDSYITGTVDFIFGNAAVVFQKCKLVPRKPMKSQKNMVTAQGRTDPNQNTGISIQDCEIRASEDLEPVKSSFPTYLGRPWKEYSRTVVMQTYIGDVVDPKGWSEWSGDFALKTLYYGEYMNRGPGAGTAKRVDWVGFHVITDPSEAMEFTVKGLIQGGEWLGKSGVAFTEGL